MTNRTGIIALVLLTALAGCAKKDEVLRGEREGVRATLGEAASGEVAAPVNTAPPIDLPAQVSNANWTHRNGSPTHRITHPALDLPLEELWSVSIGRGDTRKQRITAAPVISNGRVFTLDSAAGVSAFSTSGEAIWSVNLTPSSDNSGDASGGALTVAGDQLFVTTGFGALVALDVATGTQIWMQKMDAAMTGGVTVSDGIIYTLSRDGRAWAIDASNGRIRWEQAGVPASALVVGGPSPAVTSRVVIFPFANGDVITMLKKNGIRLWQAGLSGGRLGVARASISDITGDPVVDGSRVYIGNQSGRLAAFETQSGHRVWSINQGTLGPVWPSGGSVFMISDTNQLMRLDADDGRIIWAVRLPGFVKAAKKSRLWGEVTANYGPILAGGQVLVASGDGMIRAFDPVSGALTGSANIAGGATSPPVVAGGRLYVVSRKGKLYAFQ